MADCRIIPSTENPLEMNFVLRHSLPMLKAMKSFKDVSYLCYGGFLEALYLIKDEQSTIIEETTKELYGKDWKQLKASFVKEILEIAEVNISNSELEKHCKGLFDNGKYEELIEIYDSFQLQFPIDFEEILKNLINKDNTKLAYQIIK